MNQDLKIVIVAITDMDHNLLMIRRVKGDGNGGKWEFPAGHIDPGEIPAVAATREVEEETGLGIVLLPYGITIPTKAGKAAYYLGMVRGNQVKPRVRLAPEEHDKYIWVKPQDLDRVKPTHKRMKENLIDLLTHVFHKLKVPEKTAQKILVNGDYSPLFRRYSQRRQASSPVTLDLYRGKEEAARVRRRPDRIPHQFAVGQYWGTREDVAATYGEQVEHRRVQLTNPYILRLGEKPYWEHLKQTFKTRDPQEITDLLQSLGHDALIVTNVPVNRFRRDTGEGVAMRDSTEVILFDPSTPRKEKSMKKARRMRQGSDQPDYAHELPGPGEELKEAILVGDEVEIFLKKHVNNEGKTTTPSISGLVEQRDRNTIWIHSDEGEDRQVVPVSWDDRGNWAFLRVYRGPDQVVYYASGNPYDEDSKAVSKARGLGLILESEPPTRYESVWSLMRGETPDLDRAMGQAPQSMDVVAPSRKPKPGTPNILTQVREVVRSHGLEPDMINHLGKGRVLILTQDGDLKKELVRVLEKHGKKVESARRGFLIVRQANSVSTMGTTTVPIATDDDLMLLERRRRQRELQDQRRQSAAPVTTQQAQIGQLGQQAAPQQVPTALQGQMGQQVLQGQQGQQATQQATSPGASFVIPNSKEQAKQIKTQYGNMPTSNLPGNATQLMMNPQQAKQYVSDQSKNPAMKNPQASRSEIMRTARSLADSLRNQEYNSSSHYLSHLRNLGVPEASIIRSTIGNRKAWGNLHRYLENAGEIENARLARTASRLAP